MVVVMQKVNLFYKNMQNLYSVYNIHICIQYPRQYYLCMCIYVCVRVRVHQKISFSFGRVSAVDINMSDVF